MRIQHFFTNFNEFCYILKLVDNKVLRATAVLVGTTIGAGIYALPYAVAKVGFVTGIFYIIIIGLLVLLLNLAYGEVILATPGNHQLTGYGKIYFGKRGKLLATGALFIGIYGAMFAYLIKVGEFISLVSNRPHQLLFSLIFYLFASTIIFFGLKTVSKAEVVLESFVLLFIFFLALVSLPHLQIFNFPAFARATAGGQFSIFNNANLFFPYGVILFAFTGFSAIPEMKEILQSQPEKLKKSIFIGTFIPILIYLLFTAVIVGICGAKTTEDAIGSLFIFMPNWIARLGAFLGMLTMSSSFLALGFVLTEVWHRDFRFPKKEAFLLALLPSLILFLSGLGNFIQVLEYTGAITGGLSGILIILCFLKARKESQNKPAYQLKIPNIVLLILGIIFLLGIFSPFLGR